MKPKTKPLIILFFLILFSGLIFIPQNVNTSTTYEWLDNGDFEMGDLTDWNYTSNVYVTDSESQDGVYSCKIGDTYVGTQYITHNFTGKPVLGSILEFSLWVKSEGDETWADGIHIYYENSTDSFLNEIQPSINATWKSIDFVNDYDYGEGAEDSNCYITQIKFTKKYPYQPVYVDNITLIMPYPEYGSGNGDGNGDAGSWIASDAGINWLIIILTTLIPSLFVVAETKNYVPAHISFLSMFCLMSCVDYAIMPNIMPVWLVFISFFVTTVIFISSWRSGKNE